MVSIKRMNSDDFLQSCQYRKSPIHGTLDIPDCPFREAIAQVLDADSMAPFGSLRPGSDLYAADVPGDPGTSVYGRVLSFSSRIKATSDC
jgi:hypothetical protein